jgi:hypothetical protein
MRMHRIVPLLVGLAVAACDDASGPLADGSLVISTSTEGEDPDEDGYLLTIDDVDTLALLSSGAAEVAVPAGLHRLRLLGVATRCSVADGASIQVPVEPSGTSTVEFAIDCAGTGVRISATTRGLDIDATYRATADGVDQGPIVAGVPTYVRLEPGNRSIALTDLSPNCSISGSQQRTVTVVQGEVVPLEFAAVCTAVSGVIAVVVAAGGIDTDGGYVVTVDGSSYEVEPGQPRYLTRLPIGDHVVALVQPANCSVETNPQSVTLTGGATARDTAEVSFSVSCTERQGGLGILVTTTGTPPPHDYAVWACWTGDFYCAFYAYHLGALPPNGALVTEIEPGTWDIWLEDVPTTCVVDGPRTVTIRMGETRDLVYRVSCP